MNKENWNPTIAQHHYDKFASEFTEKELQGVNSLPTPSPQGDHKKHCAKLDWWFDAVAVVETITFKITYTKKQLFYKLLNNELKYIIDDKYLYEQIINFIWVDHLIYNEKDLHSISVNNPNIEIINN